MVEGTAAAMAAGTAAVAMAVETMEEVMGAGIAITETPARRMEVAAARAMAIMAEEREVAVQAAAAAQLVEGRPRMAEARQVS